MDFTQTIGELLGKKMLAPLETSHPWNHYLGIELELENLTLAGGGSIYGEESFDPEIHYGGDWDELDDEDQDAVRSEFYNNTSGLAIAGWTTHSDASLRNGIEFVTYPAVGGEEISKRVDTFYNKKLNYSGGPRTSTHIHIDMLGSAPYVLQSLVMLVYSVEDALFNVVDAGRKWAGYSMALSEMPASRLRNLLNPSSATQFVRAINLTQNRDRYYGLNFNVARHGTAEFRYFPGAPSKQELTEWIDLVVNLKNVAIKYPPHVLADACSTEHKLTQFLIDELGYWGMRLIRNGSTSHIFRMFEEAVAMLSDESNPERPSSVVRIGPNFHSLVLNRLMKGSKEAAKYLLNSGIPNTIMSFDDATYYISSARNLANKDNKKAKSIEAFEEGQEEEEYAEWSETLFNSEPATWAPSRPITGRSQGTTPTFTAASLDPFSSSINFRDLANMYNREVPPPPASPAPRTTTVPPTARAIRWYDEMWTETNNHFPPNDGSST